MLTLGAVAYDPKVVTIWDGFVRWFAANDLDFDYVLYTRYEALADALLAGEVDVAWNSPLAWLEVERAAARHGKTALALAMRDTDRDLRSVCVVNADAAYRSVVDLAGTVVGVGAADSPQATLIPLEWMAAAGVNVDVRRHDVLLGKHGDHVGGERDAVKALLAGKVHAAWILDANLLAFAADGTAPSGSVRVIAETEPYDHCNFTALRQTPVLDQFTALLLGMSWSDPAVRPLMELEGLRAWLPGRTSGYDALARAIARFGTIDAWLATK